ncbi:MAG TPA: universal stress protein [Blastocatellia bacterium]|nr:universal stress protein [Blastocatellia bacterium]
METFQPRLILCPTDFSELATAALRYGRDVAACFGARLLVIYADPFLPPPYFTMEQLADVTRAMDRSRQAAREHLQRYVREQVGETVEVETRVVEDHPVSAIVTTAEREPVDLIVMGTHGRSGVGRLMLGSVTERVLRETSRPVLTVRPRPGATIGAPLPVRRVLCPVNFTDVAEVALRHAAAVAQCFGAELFVLHVLESADSVGAEETARERLCGWVPPDVRARCQLQEMVRQGDAAQQIITTAESLGCDLIVLGAQHRRFFDATVIGTTTVRVTRHSPVPVLTVIRPAPAKQ